MPLTGRKVSCSEGDEKLNVLRLKDEDLKLTRPLMMFDQPQQSDVFDNLKSKINSIIESHKSNDKVEAASVYIRSLKDGRWAAINEQQKYTPASMLKMSIMIAFLKKIEGDTALLHEKVYVKAVDPALQDKRNEGHYLEPHRFYTYEELLKKMIEGSDNESANLLVEKITMAEFISLYKILNIPIDNISDINYTMNVEEMSKFYRLLYNATYLSPELSEYALQMLTHTSYHNGINRFFQNELIVAHKFGERILPGSCQVHDSGIFYIQGLPILLTVMTSGKSQAELEDLLAEIGKLVKTEIEGNLAYYKG